MNDLRERRLPPTPRPGSTTVHLLVPDTVMIVDWIQEHASCVTSDGQCQNHFIVIQDSLSAFRVLIILETNEEMRLSFEVVFQLLNFNIKTCAPGLFFQ